MTVWDIKTKDGYLRHRYEGTKKQAQQWAKDHYIKGSYHITNSRFKLNREDDWDKWEMKCNTCGKPVDEWSGIKSYATGIWYCRLHYPMSLL